MTQIKVSLEADLFGEVLAEAERRRISVSSFVALIVKDVMLALAQQAARVEANRKLAAAAPSKAAAFASPQSRKLREVIGKLATREVVQRAWDQGLLSGLKTVAADLTGSMAGDRGYLKVLCFAGPGPSTPWWRCRCSFCNHEDFYRGNALRNKTAQCLRCRVTK